MLSSVNKNGLISDSDSNNDPAIKALVMHLLTVTQFRQNRSDGLVY